MKKQSHQKRLFNSILRLYNRYSNKLQRLVSEGINQRKQDILSRRLAKMQAQLQSLYSAIKASAATAAVATALTIIAPQTAQAQTFNAYQVNPFGLSTIIGYGSAPAFADLDNDGDIDILSGQGYGNFYYFENTGTASAPAFADSVKNPFGLTNSGYVSAPAFSDIDNDGDLDVLSGNDSGNFVFYENTGTASAPVFAAPQTNPFSLTGIEGYSSPTFADIDNDGDLDLLSGQDYGNFYYFRNTGTASAPAFADSLRNPFSLTNIGQDASKPSFADLDNDGDLDMVSGEYSGNFFYFENTGTASAPAFADSLRNPFGLTNIPELSAPSFADLDNDGDLDMLTGTYLGIFFYFENTGTATSIAAAPLTTLVQVYPNPSQGIYSIVNTAGTNNTYTVTDLAGKQITSIQNTEKNTVINLSALDKGVYFLNISNEKSSQTVKLLLQ